MQISSAKCGAWMRLTLECDLVYMICYAMQQCKVNLGRLISQSLTRSAVFSHQDVTLTFVLLILLLTARQPFLP
jgi:hypothetical protein